jgi:hypothetical protein
MVRLFIMLILFEMLSSLITQCQGYSLVISELYRDPFGAESALGGGVSHEFIEITNISQDTVLLEHLMLTDGSDVDSVVPWQGVLRGCDSCRVESMWLAPSQRALILDRDYDPAVYANPQCTFTIDPGTVVLTVNDSDIGNGLQSDDGVILYRGTMSRIDTMLFCAADYQYAEKSLPQTKLRLSVPVNQEGYSLELFNFLFDTIMFSKCEKKITPGALSLLKNNTIAEWRITAIGDSLKEYRIKVAVTDKTEQLMQWRIDAGTEQSERGVLSFNKGIAEITLKTKVNAGDITLNIDNSALWLIDSKEYETEDECIRITEIYPKSRSGESEWIEIVNMSAKNSYDIHHWKAGFTDDTIEITNRSCVISPGELVILCKDSTLLSRQSPLLCRMIQPEHWHTLSNTEDTITLLTASQVKVDKVNYLAKNYKGWGYESLERLDLSGNKKSTTWRLCIKPSPGILKSKGLRNTVKLEIGPIPFTPNSDNKNDMLKILLPTDGSTLESLMIYSFDGVRIKEFSTLTGSEFFWDGLCANGRAAPIGPFYVIAEIEQSGKKSVVRNKGLLWR